MYYNIISIIILMEEIIINIDSRYRNYILYPNENKFKILFNNTYKNIISVKMISIELNNTIQSLNYNNINFTKQNNFFTLYVPNKLNDLTGTIITIDNINNKDIQILLTNINEKLLLYNNTIIENNFYIFYICSFSNITITSINNSAIINTIDLNIGWYSVYGIYNMINNIIKTSDNFKIHGTLYIYDTRYKPSRNDYINIDNTNSNNLKNDLYKIYVNDTIKFIPSKTTSMPGILDNLYLTHDSIYYTNQPINKSIINLNISLNNITSIISIHNSISNYFNIKDIPTFEIDFSTFPCNPTNNNSCIDITKLNYPSLGYFLGFRPCNNSFFLKSSYNNTQTIIISNKIYNLFNEHYALLKVNDWGFINFFEKPILAKIIFSTCFNNGKVDQYVNNEYIFRQPTDINKLDIELLDYLGNNIDLNGKDFSFTILFKQIVNYKQKILNETETIIFK